ncbi:RIO1 family [Carpediemonas membranifera]|uniref:Serine/threonine-protein kinase RIO2 n=1 Tax=Carpediemonas membranifera TaxID=201153 RepID=A0A8J6B255_9EUKA|nr:RIO1 family [Carpediemonas membranifera]|eukprot:KAG9396810.1 RIO1 family [Carpediemonas membranifera]
MKLDVETMQYLEPEDYRCLTAIEQGMKNHEWVPMPLIERIADIRRGGVSKIVNDLLRRKLVQHIGGRNDGYHLTYEGYDYLALHAFYKRGKLTGLGSKLGVGKEADIYMAQDADGNHLVVKFQRLGRTSFRAVKNKRDYHGNRKSPNWLYLSRLAALKEFAYMKVLYDNGFPTPTPVDVNRHAVVMSQVDGFNMNTIANMAHPEMVYDGLMALIVRMAQHGVVHGDFNEFNLLIGQDEKITMIDFPQMLAIDHKEAREYFERDVGCIQIVFKRKFGFESTKPAPQFDEVTEAIVMKDLAIRKEIRRSGITDKISEMVSKAVREDEAEGGDEEDSAVNNSD